ncbi:hypothetical protein [Sediminibacillus massiliensis]|uniref:hypothetical protein n=1 Tax=Sediminibacillus massiliensis TaxID=1926277 RepID=UPI0009884A96|nr:hypothetical protein [Sediminibacillus massiliensis]
MNEILSQYIPDFDGKKTMVNGMEGYHYGDSFLFIIPEEASGESYYEQMTVCRFLAEHGYMSIATPMVNRKGELVTKAENTGYVVHFCRLPEESTRSSFAYELAVFHQLAGGYPYEPATMSAYGKWKTLWLNKLTTFEQIYQQQYYERPVNNFQRLFIDTFPYISGCTENALQYLQESEEDTRFDESDQATITFQRCRNGIFSKIIWPRSFVYDHPARDIAEYIRGMLLDGNGTHSDRLRTFFTEYQSVKSLSLFGWRLVYARLLLPVHLFDFIETALTRQNTEEVYKEYKQLLRNQILFEERLKHFFSDVGLDFERSGIPILDW